MAGDKSCFIIMADIVIANNDIFGNARFPQIAETFENPYKICTCLLVFCKIMLTFFVDRYGMFFDCICS